MCTNCKVLTVHFHAVAATTTRPGRAYFECPSCFAISSEPASYELRPAS
jgi:uncharacterized C2H2 Zn-finger protein